MDVEAQSEPVDHSEAAAESPTEIVATPAEVTEESRGTFREYIESLLVTVLIVLFGTTFIVQTFKIPSPSMENTLLVGDYLLVNKFIFEGRGAWYEHLLPYREIRRGDVIVFKFPFDDHPHYVKRVIGLPGDRIRIVDQKVYVNGALLTEPYVVHDPANSDLFTDDFPPLSNEYFDGRLRPEWSEDIFNHITQGELVVPPNSYFAMGDNRDHSWDSRYWGFVRRDAVMGRPVIIYWSVKSDSMDYENTDAVSGLKGLFQVLAHLPSHIRWSRMLHEVH
jgi:signal peptidase I